MLNALGKYFTLNRRERNAVLVLISLLFALLLVKYFMVYSTASPRVVIVDLDPIMAKMGPDADPSSLNYSGDAKGNRVRKDSLFYFDPNTINSEQAIMLGFEERCATQLIKYRSKGGHFTKPTDLQKLYCMNDKLFNRLSPFIIIKTNNG